MRVPRNARLAGETSVTRIFDFVVDMRDGDDICIVTIVVL